MDCFANHSYGRRKQRKQFIPVAEIKEKSREQPSQAPEGELPTLSLPLPGYLESIRGSSWECSALNFGYLIDDISSK